MHKAKIIIGIVGIIFGFAILVFIVPYQTHQMQETNQQIQQIKSQLNDASVNLIDTCMNYTSVGDLTGCKYTLNDLKNKCQDPQYSSMSVCSDPRIDAFFTTYDNKLAYAEGVISNAESKMVDECINLISLGGGNQECISNMEEIQQNCNQYNIDNRMPVCSDPRINEILTGSIHSRVNTTTPILNQSNGLQPNTPLTPLANPIQNNTLVDYFPTSKDIGQMWNISNLGSVGSFSDAGATQSLARSYQNDEFYLPVTQEQIGQFPNGELAHSALKQYEGLFMQEGYKSYIYNQKNQSAICFEAILNASDIYSDDIGCQDGNIAINVVSQGTAWLSVHNWVKEFTNDTLSKISPNNISSAKQH